MKAGQSAALLLFFHGLVSAADFTHNCTDACIVSYCNKLGDVITEARFRKALDKLEFKLRTPFRSVADCRRILSTLGHPTIAIRTANLNSWLCPDFALVFLPPENDFVEVGHMQLLEKRDGEIFLLDAATNEGVAAKSAGWTGTHILVVALNRELGFITKVWLMNLGIGLLVGFFLFLLVRSLANAFGRLSHRTVGLVRVAIPLIVCTFPGCSDGIQAPVRVVGESTHDLGTLWMYGDRVSDATHIHTFRLRNETKSPIRIGQISATCRCTAATLSESDHFIESKSVREIPVRLDVATKEGRFLEAATVYFEDEALRDCGPKNSSE
jgi:hypothetical protein